MLTIQNAVATYGDVTAVDNVSTSFQPGITGLLGPNGAGKTTLLRLMTGASRPTSGRIEWQKTNIGEERYRRAYARKLGYLPQDFTFASGFTVRDTIKCVAVLRDSPHADIDAAVEHAMDRVGITELARRRVTNISGGQRRRVGIAQATVNMPKVLLMDEPTAGLDPSQRRRFRSLLLDRDESDIYVLSTHLIEDVIATCDFVKIMNHGNLIFDGSMAELLTFAPSGESGARAYELAYVNILGEESW